MVGGDFNLPDINWDSETIVGNRYLKAINSTYMDTFRDLGLKQIVNTPTRGDSILDLFLTSNSNLIKGQSIDAGIGDHDFVTIQTSLQLTRNKPPKRSIHLWNKADINRLKSDALKFNNFFISNYKSETNIDNMWNCIKDNLLTIIKNNVPTKISSSKIHQPWITTMTKRILRKKQRWFLKAKNSKSEKVKNKYKEIKKASQKLCRKAHDDYVQDLIGDDKDSKKLWTYIKSKKNENVGIADLHDGHKLIQDPITKANLFNIQFSSVFSIPNFVKQTYNKSKFPKMSKNQCDQSWCTQTYDQY